ncbi:MAG TPA: butyrate kinase, partial [Thermoanaerobacterales bacterium]|nr:butyrate kinase [Thermoanaerobacterales bacterium]
MYRILVINPGSTSTKIALYFDDKAIFTENIVHLHQEINKFNRIVDQYKYRRDMIIKLLNDKGCKIGELSAIVARGGILPPV